MHRGIASFRFLLPTICFLSGAAAVTLPLDHFARQQSVCHQEIAARASQAAA